jgi:hypothetical protein
MYRLLGHKSELSTNNLLLIHVYKTILKPIWTYRIQLWGTTSTFNIEILERFQSKTLCMIVDTPWYVQNMIIQGISKYQQLKKKLSIQCSSQRTPEWPNINPHAATRQQVIVKTPTTWSAYQILSVIIAFVSPILKSHKRLWTYYLQRSAPEHSSTCHCIHYLHKLLNVLVQIANKMGLQKKSVNICQL